MNLEHEFNKINKNFEKKIISESRFNYECHKLNCVARKYQLGWVCPVKVVDPDRSIKQLMVNEDFDELVSLYENGLLKKNFYDRDIRKIIAVCENLRLEFPGSSVIKESVGIECIAALITEGPDELYDELDGDDEYDEEEENDEPQLLKYLVLSSGIRIEQWAVASEAEYKIIDTDGEELGVDFEDFVATYIDELVPNWRQIIMKDYNPMFTRGYMHAFKKLNEAKQKGDQSAIKYHAQQIRSAKENMAMATNGPFQPWMINMLENDGHLQWVDA